MFKKFLVLGPLGKSINYLRHLLWADALEKTGQSIHRQSFQHEKLPIVRSSMMIPIFEGIPYSSANRDMSSGAILALSSGVIILSGC